MGASVIMTANMYAQYMPRKRKRANETLLEEVNLDEEAEVGGAALT